MFWHFGASLIFFFPIHFISARTARIPADSNKSHEFLSFSVQLMLPLKNQDAIIISLSGNSICV